MKKVVIKRRFYECVCVGVRVRVTEPVRDGVPVLDGVAEVVCVRLDV